MRAQLPDPIASAERDPTRVLLVDSHTIVREGLTVLLGFESQLAVVGHAATVGECLADAATLSPDLIITEIDIGGPETVEALRRAFPSAIVLVLSLMDTEDSIRAALAAGAHGYVLKESGRSELLVAIRTVLSGTRFLCERAAARIVSRFLDDGASARGVVVPAPITRSEREILAMVARGMSNKHIARLRERSVRTIEKQRAMLMRKLGLRNAADLTRFALEHGLISSAQAAEPVQPFVT